MKQSAGFTMIELVVVMILIGILAAVAIPRMTNLSDYPILAFRDAVSSGLRYAQKTAVSHRRVVCATFTAGTVTLRIASTPTLAGCDTNLALPNGAVVQSGDMTNAVFNSVPAPLFFQSDGRITTNAAGTAVFSGSAAISDQTVTVEGATGYVE